MFNIVRSFFAGEAAKIAVAEEAQGTDAWKPSLTRAEANAKRAARKRQKAAKAARRRNRRK